MSEQYRSGRPMPTQEEIHNFEIAFYVTLAQTSINPNVSTTIDEDGAMVVRLESTNEAGRAHVTQYYLDEGGIITKHTSEVPDDAEHLNDFDKAIRSASRPSSPTSKIIDVLLDSGQDKRLGKEDVDGQELRNLTYLLQENFV